MTQITNTIGSITFNVNPAINANGSGIAFESNADLVGTNGDGTSWRRAGHFPTRGPLRGHRTALQARGRALRSLAEPALATMGAVRFAWDTKKATLNAHKHGVSFGEASTALRDTLAVTGSDPGHSLGEQRFVTFGVSEHVVSHTEEGDVIRIIHHQCSFGHETGAQNL